MIAKQAQIEATSPNFDPASPPTVISNPVGVLPVANPQQGEFINNPKSPDPLLQMLQKENVGVSTSASSSNEELLKQRDREADVDKPRDTSADASPETEAGESLSRGNKDKALGNEAAPKNIVVRDGDATQRVIMGMANMSLETRRENPNGGVRLNVTMTGSNKPINHVKIPATQHDNRKLFVGGLPTNGKVLFIYAFLYFHIFSIIKFGLIWRSITTSIAIFVLFSHPSPSISNSSR